MLYAEINGTTLILYPYGFAQLQAQNPYTNYGSNQDVAYWFPQTNAQTTGNNGVYASSGGFTLGATALTTTNIATATYIFLAIA